MIETTQLGSKLVELLQNAETIPKNGMNCFFQIYPTLVGRCLETLHHCIHLRAIQSEKPI